MWEIISILLVLAILYLLFKWLFSTIWGIFLIVIVIIAAIGYFKDKKQKKQQEQNNQSLTTSISNDQSPKENISTKPILSNVVEKENLKQPQIEKPKILSFKPTHDYIVIDTETTGLNVHTDKVIQLSALKFVNDKLVDTFNEYINPDGIELSESARLITGITDADLKDKPKFADIIPKFQEFVGESVWVGHNINKFDIPILFYNGYRQKNEFNTNLFLTIDTYLMAKNIMENINISNYKLTTLKYYFDLSGKSHDSLGDCEVTAEVYKRLRDGKLAPGEIKTDTLFANKRFCITGVFKEASKDEIKHIIELHGGKVTGSVSHLTNYLVDGKQVSSNVKDGKSNSERKAEEYGIPTISYQDLMRMLSDTENNNELNIITD